MRFNNGGAYITAGLAGLGIISVTLAEANPRVQSGNLAEVLSDWTLGRMPISLIYPDSRHLSARVRVFADWAEALMATAPLWMLTS
jgi:DNA-binding transcriptional LysR family regulator